MPLKTCLWFCHSESLNAKLAVWLRSACQVYHLLKALSSSALRLSGSLLFTLFLGCLEKISLLFLIKMPADWIVWKASGGIRAICSRYCQRQSMSSDSYVILYLIAWNTSLFPCFLGFSLGLKHIQPNVFKRVSFRKLFLISMMCYSYVHVWNCISAMTAIVFLFIWERLQWI